MKKILIIGALVILIAVILAVILFKKAQAPGNGNSNGTASPSQTPVTSGFLETVPLNQPATSGQVVTSPPKSILTEPVADFGTRVTKKPFGIYVTPQNSPVSPERFTGYHTGSDAEYQDVTVDVPVFAVADGTVVLSKTASGYGGVFMIEIIINGSKHTVLYGHIRPSSLPKVGKKITKGEKVALLGTGYSTETDGERRHLHFAILLNNSLNIKGYVSTKSQLSGWLDPLNYF